MITEKDITDMYVHLRKTNQNIPSEALDFMKMACLDKLQSYTTNGHVSLDVRNDNFGTKLCVRENFKNKDNRYCELSLTPNDLLDYREVGYKLMCFGRKITQHDIKNNIGE